MKNFSLCQKAKHFLLFGVFLVCGMTLSVSEVSAAQSNSVSGDISSATISGSSGMQYVSENSDVATRTMDWARALGYTSAVNVYYAKESDNAGYCTAPDPASQGSWSIVDTNNVTSTGVWTTASIGALADGSDYCLLVRDASGSVPWAVTDLFTVDNTNPTLSSATTNDSDGNGKIDELILVFNESMDDSIEATTGMSYGTYTLAGNGAWSVTTNPNDTLTIDVTEGGVCDRTDQTGCDTNDTSNFSITSGAIKDVSGNLVNNYTAAPVTDGGKPAMVGAETVDGDSDGKIDEVTVYFSEDLLNASLTDENGGSGIYCWSIHYWYSHRCWRSGYYSAYRDRF